MHVWQERPMTPDAVTLMGIVNVTPDSFSDGGRFHHADRAIAHGLTLAEEGAHVLDIGGESTRPGAATVDINEELSRVIPVIEGLASRTECLISIDTRKPEVARAAVAAGAGLWNDVTALTYSPDSLGVAAELGVQVCLMHAQGTPETMQDKPVYADVVAEVVDYLSDRIVACAGAGISRERLIVDPGIGFGKTLAHNLALLAHLDRLSSLNCPVLLGASRKRFIAALDREGDAIERLGGSIAAVLAGRQKGASWFRVHDVAATRQALAVAGAIAAAD
ncbi:dihydropteroate synthase [Parvularcula sp. LCG005]|uniref:dihydropteroate synthase n=1 Tax=Parvularcula sp. LCG005 TaxID=3078805 RepID=UPI0029421A16|nr:dihydropteroate synthase [Parvularcula sp. LCG005]WOI54246.1 dihydropteroate synthase [Parvularcula sp. LCG005]